MRNVNKISVAIAIVAGLLLAGAARAEQKEVTVKGEAKCAKCSLNEGSKCQTVIQSEANGKTVTYYLASNETSKKFHANVCHEPKKVTVTGTVTEKDGKQMLTAEKIELAAK